MPDVSFDADPNTGVAIYDSYDYGSTSPGPSRRHQSRGPVLGGPDRHRRPVPRRRGAQPLTRNGPVGPVRPRPTRTDGYFHDITSGNNGYPAGTGYDMATGIGTPIANVLVPAWRRPQRPT